MSKYQIKNLFVVRIGDGVNFESSRKLNLFGSRKKGLVSKLSQGNKIAFVKSGQESEKLVVYALAKFEKMYYPRQFKGQTGWINDNEYECEYLYSELIILPENGMTISTKPGYKFCSVGSYFKVNDNHVQNISFKTFKMLLKEKVKKEYKEELKEEVKKEYKEELKTKFDEIRRENSSCDVIDIFDKYIKSL